MPTGKRSKRFGLAPPAPRNLVVWMGWTLPHEHDNNACAASPRLSGAILSYGFRPFFLLGAIYAGLAILVARFNQFART